MRPHNRLHSDGVGVRRRQRLLRQLRRGKLPQQQIQQVRRLQQDLLHVVRRWLPRGDLRLPDRPLRRPGLGLRPGERLHGHSAREEIQWGENYLSVQFSELFFCILYYAAST